MCTSGSGFTSWGAGIALTVNWTPQCAGVYDGAAYRGITFTLSRSIAEGKPLRFGLATAGTTEAGGTCETASVCTDSYGADIVPTSQPQSYTLAFSQLRQAGWSAVTPWNPKGPRLRFAISGNRRAGVEQL
jgi:hypothetical protein